MKLQESQIANIGSALAIACLLSSSPAFAGWGKVTVSDGSGDGVQVKHYLLGQKSLVMQDQNGDQIEHKEGLFGINRETGVDVLGNGTTVKHGLLRGTSVEGHDMLGDSWKSKKTFMGLGPRVTTVNAKGVHDMLDGLMHGQMPGQMTPPGQMMPGFNPAMNPAMNSAMNPEQHPGLNPGMAPGQMMMPERAGEAPPSNFSQYAPARGFGEPEGPGGMPPHAPDIIPAQP